MLNISDRLKLKRTLDDMKTTFTIQGIYQFKLGVMTSLVTLLCWKVIFVVLGG